MESRKGVRRAVFALQEYRSHRPGDNDFEFSDVTSVFNKTSSERAIQIGAYYERRVRELSVLPWTDPAACLVIYLGGLRNFIQV